MKKKMLKLFCILMIALTLTKETQSSSKQILNQLTKLTSQKKQLFPQKNTKLQTSTQQSDILNLNTLELIQTKIGTENTYRQFFNQNSRCNSLDGQLDFISKISSLPDNFCLETPLSDSAQAVFQSRLKLSAEEKNTGFSKKVLDLQLRFLRDMSNQVGVYGRLKQIGYGPLSAASRKYGECMKKYQTNTNPNPTQCQKFYNQLKKAEDYYGRYAGKYMDFGMSTKGPTFYMWRLNDTYSKNMQNQQQLRQVYTDLQKNLKLDYEECQKGLINIKNLTNAGLTNLVKVTGKLNSQKYKIGSIFAELSKIQQKAQNLTASIQKLAQQLKMLF